ncbi:hypothetical protein L6452_12113 [Arctium lappa]|uniref:Uncharacterized protein n=2 Tax=Arctium lappa TaxID=4217 RepID=A0ACB9DPZ2_ARCLA|nr:hypothetical protein L6452_12108 [Arctium lappa]KAI3748782.1 hypothetical protein L6452_12113 [Arctium lappa]
MFEDIWNSFKELEESELQKIHQDFQVPSFLIDPFHKYFPATLSSLLEPDRSSITWLDRQAPNSVLYISFGSAAQLEEQDFLEVAHGLATSNQPFLWVMRPELVKGSEWLEQLPNGFLDESLASTLNLAENGDPWKSSHSPVSGTNGNSSENSIVSHAFPGSYQSDASVGKRSSHSRF